MMNLSSPTSAVYTMAASGVLDASNFEQDATLRRITYKSNNVTECVQVPTSEHVAEIVGRQGCKIKALRAKTNTYIKTPSRGEDPVFVITGRPDDVASAKREILAAAEHFTQIRASRRNSSSQSPVSLSTLSSLPSLTNGDEPTTTIQVRVPYRVVGLVVGPKGATIKRIQQNTNTYIVTPSRDKEPCFEVTGTKENVERAKEEIECYIAMRTGGSISDEDNQTQHSSPEKDSPMSLYSSPVFTGSKSLVNGSPLSADPYSTSKSFQLYYGKNSPFDSWAENRTSLPLTTAVFSATNNTPSTAGTTSPIPISRSMSLPSASPPGRRLPTMFEFNSFTSALNDYPPSPVNSYSSSGSDGIAATSPRVDHKVPTCFKCKCSEVVAALVPCGHHIFCQSCAMDVVTQKGDCPICHIEAESMLRIYHD